MARASRRSATAAARMETRQFSVVRRADWEIASRQGTPASPSRGTPQSRVEHSLLSSVCPTPPSSRLPEVRKSRSNTAARSSALQLGSFGKDLGFASCPDSTAPNE